MGKPTTGRGDLGCRGDFPPPQGHFSYPSPLIFPCSLGSPLHRAHHAPGECHDEEHHAVLAAAGAAQRDHPGLRDPLLREAEPHLHARRRQHRGLQAGPGEPRGALPWGLGWGCGGRGNIDRLSDRLCWEWSGGTGHPSCLQKVGVSCDCRC